MPTWTAADGAALHYDLTDGPQTRPPVLAIAGGACRDPEYLGDLAGLGSHVRLVVPHLRGVGRSPAPDDPHDGTFWHQGEDVEGLREHLGAERLVVLAHSAGTRVAVSWAARHPDRVAGLVLVCPPTGYLVDEPPDAAALAERRVSDRFFGDAWGALATGPETADEEAFNAWQHRCAPAGYARWDDTARAHSLTGRWHLAAAQAYFEPPPPADLAARLWDVGAPVLVVGGTADCLTGVAPVAALADLFPDRTLALLDGVGHYPWVEDPAAFRGAVDGFLASVADVAAPNAR